MAENKIKIPEAPESERIIAGSLIVGGTDAMKRISHIVKSKDFYTDYRYIYRAAEKLFNDRKDIDIASIAEVLRQHGYLDVFDGVTGLTSVTNDIYSAAHIVTHARIVADRATLRRIIQASQDIIKMTQGEDDLEQLLRKAEDRINGVTRTAAAAEDRLAMVDLDDWLEKAREDVPPDGTVRGLSTGYKNLDEMLEGFEPGEMITLTGHTKHGKSRLAANIVLNVAKQGHNVLMINTEMTKLQTARRFLDMIGTDTIPGKIILNDKGNLEAMDVIHFIERAKERGVGLVVVDHLHFFSRSIDNQTNEISKITKEFKEAAVEYNMPLLLLCHVQQGDTKKRPTLQMLKNSSSIAQDSDCVITVWIDDRPDSTSSVTEVLRLAHRSATKNVRKILLYNQGMRLVEQEPETEKLPVYNPDQFTEGGGNVEGIDFAGW